MLKKVLRQIEVIKTSRSGIPNFESHHIEANDLQAAVAQYFQFRGTGKVCTHISHVMILLLHIVVLKVNVVMTLYA